MVALQSPAAAEGWIVSRLQDLVLETADSGEFLDELFNITSGIWPLVSARDALII
ncbi:hypothetical protein ACVWY0_000281 [Arthrobacter sp. UYNi723]